MACLYAFDLLYLRADSDLRPVELVGRRAMLKKLLRKAGPVLIFSEQMDAADGERMFRRACALGLEGIVSKRLDKPYSSGRCQHWRKVKNPSYVHRGRANVVLARARERDETAILSTKLASRRRPSWAGSLGVELDAEAANSRAIADDERAPCSVAARTTGSAGDAFRPADIRVHEVEVRARARCR